MVTGSITSAYIWLQAQLHMLTYGCRLHYIRLQWLEAPRRLADGYTAVTLPLHYRDITVTLPLHDEAPRRRGAA